MNYFDFIIKYQTPAIPIQKRDATLVEVKEPIRSVKRTFSSPYIEQQYNAYLEKKPWDLVGAENLIANLADPNIYKSMFLPWVGYNLMKNSNQNTDENLTH